MRISEQNRSTAETKIQLRLDLDGSGKSDIHSGCGFLDHMLTLFARHGRFDLSLTCVGDNEVDDHHTVEDIGITLGDAFREALGDMRGITRYGSFLLPMDEALVMSAVDLSGRVYLNYALDIPTQKVGSFDTQLCEEFFWGFVRHANMTLHLRQLEGRNSHHIMEAAFKSVARSLKDAVKPECGFENEIPSTKGVL